MKVFRGKLESACLSIHVSVCPCVSLSVYKILVFVKALQSVQKNHRPQQDGRRGFAISRKSGKTQT